MEDSRFWSFLTEAKVAVPLVGWFCGEVFRGSCFWKFNPGSTVLTLSPKESLINPFLHETTGTALRPEIRTLTTCKTMGETVLS